MTNSRPSNPKRSAPRRLIVAASAAMAVLAGGAIGSALLARITDGDGAPLVAATWADVEAGSGRKPTITIPDGIYPDSAGVQFWVNGAIDERSPSARPDGYDATGPHDDSTFHIWPTLDLTAGDVLEAHWVDHTGTPHRSQLTVADPTPTSTEPAPAPAPVAAPTPEGFPNQSNTGVQPGVNLTPSGSITVTRDGAVIENLDITGTIIVNANNVTIRNVRVRKSPGAWYGIFTGYGNYTGTVIENVELDGQATQATNSAIGVCCGNYTLRHANIYGFRSSANMTGNNLIEHSYMHDHWWSPESHGAAVATTGTGGPYSNMIVRYNNLIHATPQGSSSPLGLYGPLNNVLVEGNLLNGGSYCTYGGGDGSTNVRYINNKFGRTVYDNCGRHGPVAAWNASGPGNQWTNNTWADTNKPL